jgi:uridine kinase
VKRQRNEEVDIIVLEGIYLLKHAYRHYFDLAFWVECTFETALQRALQRGQEGASCRDDPCLQYHLLSSPTTPFRPG